ncbi:MAG TPA: gluconate 2-dehydrogenase subunit 3 family protein [Steroidobacteraceae bacterium]|nr:gluconate 2-dehydrogenase subunit 3 family protein [Steroidobacteraceae bacterium]
MTNRRSFLRGASVLLGSAALGNVLSAFAASPRRATFFAEDEMRALRAVVDVILPATDSPSASSADTHYFIDLAIPACATPAAQKTFREVLANMAQSGFADRPMTEQVAWLEARAAADLPLAYEQSFFKILKDYTLTGYFLSETGATKALAYEKVPGGYWGDVPLAPDQKAWAI